MSMRRRDALKTIGALAGAASASKLLSACSGENGPGTIDTLVFLMMENRSYDHYFGARSMLEGKPGDGLLATMSNPDSAGATIPIYPADDASLCVPDPPHSWGTGRDQFGEGRNDGFVRAQETLHGAGSIQPMQYLVRDQLPVSWALADAYTSCDRWFCSLMGPTLPNRMYWHGATSNGARYNDEILEGAVNDITTIYHRLNDVGVDWALYFGDVPALGLVGHFDLTGHVRRFNNDFFLDAKKGKLPPVVYIDPGYGSNDDHPPKHPLLGQQLISSIYTALATSPHWERCLLVVTYDEHGGFFDHVPPPKTADERAADGFDQLGFRVPALLAGPYVKRSYVSSVQYDHTSALKHIQNTFGTAPLNARCDAASDLTDCIDLDRLARGEPAAPIQLPAVELDESVVYAPDCNGTSFSVHDHDILRWADAAVRDGRLDRRYDLRHEHRDYLFGIADYLDSHNLGRIRRGR
jgi:phospholipase C